MLSLLTDSRSSAQNRHSTWQVTQQVGDSYEMAQKVTSRGGALTDRLLHVNPFRPQVCFTGFVCNFVCKTQVEHQKTTLLELDQTFILNLVLKNISHYLSVCAIDGHRGK